MEASTWAWPWIGVASLVALWATLLDKSRAVRGGRRLPERILLLLAAVGGSPGLAVGMVLARHKTRKANFLLRFFIVVALQGIAAWWVWVG